MSREAVDHVFSYCVCHGPKEASCGETGSLLMETMVRNVAALVGKKAEESRPEKDGELPTPFMGALKEACEELAGELLPRPGGDKKSEKRLTARSSRQSVRGWEDVFAAMKPIGKRGETNKVQVSPAVRELGKLLLEGKMGAAKKFAEKKKSEAEAAEVEETAIMSTADGVYTGPRRDGVPHGKGKMALADGEVYEGEFVDGAMTGRGVLLMGDGSRYEGEFRNGLLHGQGKFVYANGDSYVGEFADDAYHGNGIYQSSSSAYDGQFQHGLRHGKGSFRAHTFSYVGEYQHDQMHGLGIYTFANGDEYKGEFVDSKFHGQGVFKTATRTVEGSFANGRYLVE